MKPGDVLETAIWLDGTETPELRARYESDLRVCLASLGSEAGMVFKPVIFTEKPPGADRVPAVPDQVQGPDVRLLVAETEVLCRAPYVTLPGSFVDDLDPLDLTRLREITRKFCSHPLTDAECDEIIDDIGPETAVRTLREAVDGRVVH